MNKFLSILLLSLLSATAYAGNGRSDDNTKCGAYHPVTGRNPVFIVYDDNSGYPSEIRSLVLNVPRNARCVQLETIAEVETGSSPLANVTTAGIEYYLREGTSYAPLTGTKALGRTNYTGFANENSILAVVPLDDDTVYFKLYNLFPAGSDPSSTFNAVVVTLTGYYTQN